MSNPLLSLLQISDSNFPSGAFSHSFGLETYIYEQVVYDSKTFAHLMKAYIQTQLAYTEGLACRLAYDAIQRNHPEKLWTLDIELSALSLAKETRDGNRRIGERMVKLFCELYDLALLQEYEERIKRRVLSGHSAIAFSIVCFHLQMNRKTTVSSYLYTSIQSLIQNAVRAIPLGQTDGQKLLVAMQPIIDETTDRIELASEEDLGRSAPGLEIAQMRHEQLPVRLFMS